MSPNALVGKLTGAFFLEFVNVRVKYAMAIQLRALARGNNRR
jgi:hypothetical protein